jgi:26S proteasome regulatory subunit, ATPase 3, interacting protein
MAPRKPKPTDDDTSSTTSELPSVLKPKTEKAKVTKPKAEKAKSEKPKTEKAKAEKGDKAKVVKKEAVEKKDGDKGKDGKEKVKAVNGEEAVELMGRYLREQNRPYSATEVSANLHGKVSLPLLH